MNLAQDKKLKEEEENCQGEEREDMVVPGEVLNNVFSKVLEKCRKAECAAKCVQAVCSSLFLFF